jgi:hypothetical protein
LGKGGIDQGASNLSRDALLDAGFDEAHHRE